MFKSQIRAGQINDLLERADRRNYAKYLPRLTLKKLRGFIDQTVSFDFPVTALIGPNGGGKTTVLGAAACAYKEVLPRRFFAKSGAYDESMQDWSIEYEIVDRDINRANAFRRTASFKNLRWNRDAPERTVLIFGVSRTVPANERTELSRCATSGFSVPLANVSNFDPAVSDAVSRILGKDVTEYKKMKLRADGRIELLTGVTPLGSGYSEFHFGAGESSVIRMVSEVEAAADQALILIEEIENGLHPVATVRLVEYLIDVADRKRVQVIFTTHSNEALIPLPSKAIWVATQDRLFQGKLDVGSLRAITGQIEKQAVVFVEDELAKAWVEAAIRHRARNMIEHVEVHAMQGDGIAVATHRYHNANPAINIPSVCFVDGDSPQEEDANAKIYRLPGGMPESKIFEDVMAAWDRFGGKLAVALLREYEQAEEVRRICVEVLRDNMDRHLLFAQVGERIGLLPETTVRMAFCTIWTQAQPAQTDAIVAAILPLQDAVEARLEEIEK